jgi:hypothetical protein
MRLDSLPARPLELSELRTLEESGRFRTVVPVAVFDLEESDHRLVAAAVLVTESVVLAAGYDHDSGWTVVERADAPGSDADLEAQVLDLNPVLQQWAAETGQRWAQPDGGSALLEAFRE